MRDAKHPALPQLVHLLAELYEQARLVPFLAPQWLAEVVTHPLRVLTTSLSFIGSSGILWTTRWRTIWPNAGPCCAGA